MTLDEVRKTRFHMSRRNGYEVTDVDIFVDKVEETIQTLTSENDALRSQLGGAAPAAAGGAEADQLRQQVAQARNEADRARADNARLQGELEQQRQAAMLATANVGQAPGSDDMRRQLEAMHAQLIESQNAAASAQSQLMALKNAPAAPGALDPAVAQELEGLRAQLAATRNAAATLPSQSEYMQLTGENQHLREQLGRIMSAEKSSSAPLTVTTSPEASSAVVRLVQMATEQAESLVSEATAEANRRRQSVEDEVKTNRQEADTYVSQVKSEADSHAAKVRSDAQFAAEDMTRKATDSADQMTSEAQAKADQTERQAREQAERLVQEAQARAANVDTETAARRKELFSALESERDTLMTKVEKLRTYEKSYRQTMTSYLKEQVDRLDSSQFQPKETPELLATPARTAQDWAVDSTTPRLDALLGADAAPR